LNAPTCLLIGAPARTPALERELAGLGLDPRGHAATIDEALEQLEASRAVIAFVDDPELGAALRARTKIPLVLVVDDEAAAITSDALGLTALRRPIGADALRLAIALAAERGARPADQRAQDLLRAFYECSPDALLLVDSGGTVHLANNQAHALLGFPAGALLGVAVDTLVPDACRSAHAGHRRAFHERSRPRPMGTLKEPIHARRRDGEDIPVDVSLGPIDTVDGPMVVVSLRDMRPRLQAEEEKRAFEERLRDTQRLEALGTLAGGIAHDFNNILAAIVANLELARGDLPAAHPASAHLDQISAASQRATLLVRQILAFSRRQPPRRAVIGLAAVVREAVHLLRRTLPARIALQVAIDPGVPAVHADATQIHQVLMNLGTNAWHAITEPSGTIAIHLSADHEHGTVRLAVRDDGCGMDLATRERIFEPFFTTKPLGKGSGLGLSVVHGIIHEHGGEISVESHVGIGTTVTVVLPIATEAEEEAPPERERRLGPESNVRAAPCRVALIDDDPVLVTVGEALLSRLGHRAVPFTDPKEALRAICAAPSAFDVVITDFNMPGMSGLDVSTALAAVRADLPVILASGHADRTDEELRSAGIRHRLDKPYDLDKLVRVLAEARS